MKAFQLIAVWMTFSLCASAGEADIGFILKTEQAPQKDRNITVKYTYDGISKLTIEIYPITLNAAARGVTGNLAVKKGTIHILPRERYDERGPVESLEWHTIQYVITEIKPGVYKLIHDDTFAEGSDHVIKIDLDLKEKGEGEQIIKFKPGEPNPFE